MSKLKYLVTSAAIILVLPSMPLLGVQDVGQKSKYSPRRPDPTLKRMEQKNKEESKARVATTQRIRDVQESAKTAERNRDTVLRLDFSDIDKPASPSAFKSEFHFPPVRQYLTGNCWCFSTTSFFESELFRLSGRKIKLSEMYTVYHEYLEKARRYVQQRGDSFFSSGSEGNAVILVWRKYGIVPAGMYKGELDPDGLYDETEVLAEMKGFLKHVKDQNAWDEESAIAHLRLIMDKHMGPPPTEFMYEGAKTTPKRFLADTLKLNLDDYICVMSTLKEPFHAYGTYDVKGNWWHSDEYYNVPLDEFMQIIRYAIGHGYTVRLNGDVSEPGYNGFEDAAIVPTFDITPQLIDQDAREFRFANKTTTDDHDIHLVGHTTVGDDDWYLIKDSASAAQHGAHKGYMFYREDYIKLKMLTYLVHKDAVRGVVKGFE